MGKKCLTFYKISETLTSLFMGYRLSNKPNRRDRPLRIYFCIVLHNTFYERVGGVKCNWYDYY